MLLRGPRTVTVAIAAAVALSACTGPTEPPPASVVTRAPADAVGTADDAVSVSRQLFDRSDAVVLTGDDEDAQTAAATAAEELGVPLLQVDTDDPEPVTEEVDRLGAGTVLAVGVTDDDVPDLADVTRVEPTNRAVTDAVDDVEVGRTPPADPGADGLLVLVRDADDHRPAVLTARNAGARLLEAAGGDPRADDDAIEALRADADGPVLAVGGGFRSLGYTVTAVRQELEQPGGGLLVFPGRHVVALYGHPGTKALGLLGEQGVRKSVDRARKYARPYEKLADDPVVPAFEIIATVASSSKGKDGDYSAEARVGDLEPLVDAAEKAGFYVVIDLQPGRTDFLSQAQRYESLLERPHVGLALDPEWRLGKKQKHLRQIGSVSAAEVNRTAEWLADLTRENELPQKLFVLHQFSPSMIRDRGDLDTGHPELSTVIHVDGQGTPAAKKGTWNRLRDGAPKDVHWGWKNFLDEDDPMLIPQKTWKIRPVPDLVTYQ